MSEWKLVPVEPTQIMLDEVCNDSPYPCIVASNKVMREVYQTMIAASPSPPVPGVTEKSVTEIEDIIRGCKEAGPSEYYGDGTLRTYYAGYNLTALARALTAALPTRSASQLKNREDAG